MNTSPRRLLTRLRPRTRRHWLLSAATVLLVGGLAVYALLFSDLPSIDRLQAGLALPSTRIYDRNGTLLYEILPQEGGRNTALPLDEIPMDCQNAVIATEDANFYSHPGVDIVGIIRALWIDVRGGEVLAGGSTITQQVARNLLMDPQQRAERSLRRKLRLSQAEFGKLLSVSEQAVYMWERRNGAIRVRDTTRANLMAIRDFGAREARQRLEGMGVKRARRGGKRR